MNKTKILTISDHPLSHSGVGSQANFLFNYLSRTGKYELRSIGAAIRHEKYDLVQVNENWQVLPINGFGNIPFIRTLLLQERPKCLILFTDPRFFEHIWLMQDEIKMLDCKIVYNYLWDGAMYPKYNKYIYDSVDTLNCISHLSYTQLKQNYEHPEKVNFIPHSLPQDIVFPINEEQIKNFREKIIGSDKKDWFTALWTNRNAKRKRPSDVMWSWKLFLDKLEQKHGHRNAVLVMHTDPNDLEGPNLFELMDHFGIRENVKFSTDVLQHNEMNVLYNICDVILNIAFNEGFGLSVLQGLQTGKPVICVSTGGMTAQGTQILEGHPEIQNGICLQPEFVTMVGSQSIPYINEDYVSVETVSNAILETYEWGPEKRKEIGQRSRDYVLRNFSYEKMCSEWDRTLQETLNKPKSKEKIWTCQSI